MPSYLASLPVAEKKFLQNCGDQNLWFPAFECNISQADVFDIAGWRDQLEGTIGVISCLGAFGSNEFMYKVGLSL